MIEMLLNRWRGTGDIFNISGFAITGTMIYAFYMFVLVSILSNPIYGFIATLVFLVGESYAWGKWIGHLTYPENYNKGQFENNKAGSNFPFIHQTANYFINQSKPYYYSVLALSIRGLYWWLPLYLLFAYIGLINYFEAIVIGFLLGIGFPIACYIGRNWRFEYKSKLLLLKRGWENQEVVYGLIQGLCLWYVVIIQIVK